MGGVTVRVPATTANLGPGYDAFGLALDLHNVFSAELAEDWSVVLHGEGADTLRADAENPVARAMTVAFETAGRPDLRAALVCDNAIPTGRGLGSSAAAIVGGLVLGAALAGATFASEDLVRMATRIEGHPDNVAAAILGGFTISTIEGGDPVARSVPIGAGLAVVLAVARSPFKTTQSRDLLPDRVPHSDAAYNAGHAAMLAAGIITGSDDLIAAGLHDRLHEQYRSDSLPGFEQVTQALTRAGAAGAVLSGAGPTVVGLVPAFDDGSALERARRISALAAEDVERAGSYRPPAALALDRRGARIEG